MRAILAVFALISIAACAGMQLKGQNATTAAKKDCAACEKMCTVAGDAEKNPGAVEACKADCKKTCTP